MKKDKKILGVRIDDFSVVEMKKIIENILGNDPEQKFVTTLNPEILLKAHRDEDYQEILNCADLNICDGFGIKFASFMRGKKIKSRFAGADLADFLLGEADRKKLRILVIVAKNSLSMPSEIEQAIGEKYPNLSAKSEYFSASQSFIESGIIKEAEIVFVNFGAPEQENFIHENRTKFKSAKILIGVGGTFDFFTGKICRAPKLFRDFGFEWLWRLLQEPKRFKRIWNAVVVFPLIVLKN